MKKTINYFTLICAGALAVAGCQKPEMESNAAVSGDRTIITATLSEDGADSKTQMLPGSDADSYKVVWQAGDAIKTNGTAPVPTSQILYNQAIIDGIVKSAELGHEIEVVIPEI